MYEQLTLPLDFDKLVANHTERDINAKI